MLRRRLTLPPEHLYPPDEWRVIEAQWSAEFAARMETAFALSNGYVGIRGTLEEGRPHLAPGTFVNGFHETWPIAYAEEAYGLARTGQTIVNVPDASLVELFVDDEPLYMPTARNRDYSRVLDMRNGLVSRQFVWTTPSGKHVTVRTRRLVSLDDRHLVAMTYEVSVDQPAPVVIVSRVLDRNRGSLGDELLGNPADPRLARKLSPEVLRNQFAEGADGQLLLGYQTARSGMTLALAAHHVVETAADHRTSTNADGVSSDFVVTVDAYAGCTVSLTKFVTYQSSRRVPARELGERCVRGVERARRDGFEEFVARQRHHMDLFWDRADVVVDSHRDPIRVQQAIRWNLFQLAQASWRAEGAGIPAKGLTGSAYDGHYFWDTEAFILPFLAYTQPRIARNLLRFRHSMLPLARERATVLGHRGAVFPWRTINGMEASANFQAGTAQYHLNANIAYAIRRYVDVRGDVGFLAEVGAEILIETARMWQDLGFEDDDGHFHIHSVTGPDEYTTVVNDNAFTNLMARLNLHYAASAVRRLRDERPDAYARIAYELHLDPKELETWDRTAEHMYVPHDAKRGITPQDDTFLDREIWDLESTPAENFPLLLHYHPLAIYRRQVLKQADVVMAMFLLGNEFDMEQKRRNFAYYDPLTTGDSSLSAGIQSIVASEIGREKDACRYFDFALLMDLADVSGDVSNGVHVASSFGAWMALVFGFGGVRDFDGKLTIDPHLPKRWRSMAFSLRFHDREVRVSIEHDRECYRLDEGDPLEVTIRGQLHRLEPGETFVVPVGVEEAPGLLAAKELV